MRVPRGVRYCSAGSAPTRSVQPCVCIPRPAEGQRKDPRAHECDESGVKQQQQQQKQQQQKQQQQLAAAEGRRVSEGMQKRTAEVHHQ